MIGARVAERAREPVVKQSNNLRDEKLEKSSRVRCFLHASRKDVKEDTVDRAVFVARAAVSIDVT